MSNSCFHVAQSNRSPATLQIRKLSADVDAMFEEVDLVVMPTCVKPPPRHVPKDKGIEGIMDAGST